jgi:hypothetical protein
VFDAMWVHPRDMGDAGELPRCWSEHKSMPAFTALVSDPEVKAALVAQTGHAVARCVQRPVLRGRRHVFGAGPAGLCGRWVDPPVGKTQGCAYA